MNGNSMGVLRLLMSTRNGPFYGGQFGMAGPQGNTWTDKAIQLPDAPDVKASISEHVLYDNGCTSIYLIYILYDERKEPSTT